MTLERVEVKKAEQLPIEKQRELGIFSGLVEIRYEKNSPVEAEVNEIEGTFSDRLKEKVEDSDL